MCNVNIFQITSSRKVVVKTLIKICQHARGGHAFSFADRIIRDAAYTKVLSGGGDGVSGN